jgi:nucleoside diphosphate kinase
MPVERSFLLIKPDGLLPEIIEEARTEIETRGLRISEYREVELTPQIIKTLYPLTTTRGFERENLDYLGGRRVGDRKSVV